LHLVALCCTFLIDCRYRFRVFNSLGLLEALPLGAGSRAGGAALLVGVVAHWLEALPLVGAGLLVVSLGAGSASTSSGEAGPQTLKSGFVDLPAIFL
jgi:hypothetical protein